MKYSRLWRYGGLIFGFFAIGLVSLVLGVMSFTSPPEPYWLLAAVVSLALVARSRPALSVIRSFTLRRVAATGEPIYSRF